MFKKCFILIFLLMLFTLAACKSNNNQSTPNITVPHEITDIIGLEDMTVTKNEYFNPLDNVKILNQNNEDITYLVRVTGNVHYGVLGEYELTYQMTYGEDEINQTRLITVDDGTINRPINPRNNITSTIVNANAGSYRVGSAPEIDHPIQPQLLNPNLLDQAVPSNGWWTSLLAANYGGGNGIYTNPLRSAFSNDGVEITNPGSGFVQYWNPDGYNTMANFSLALPDMHIKTTNLNLGYTTHVIDYSDTTVKVAMRNTGQPQDQMVMTYAQGSPFVFAEVAKSDSAYLRLASNGVASYEYFTVDGQLISGNTYTGDGIVIRLVQKHIGYETYRPAQVGQPIYGDRYFLVSTPSGSLFNLSTDNHPSSLLNKISMNLGDENYFSVAAIESLTEASFYHQHAYTATLKGDVSYQVQHKDSIVETNYHLSTQHLKENNLNEPLQFLMPHHYQNSTQEVTDYSFNTVRGELKLIVGSHFQTNLSFHGLLPAMTYPINNEFSTTHMTTYLNDLDTRTEINDLTNFLNDEGPYWNGKAIYPLSQGIIIADQIGDDALKLSFISKLRYVLADWFTYESVSDERYLYYNEAWGSVYYSNNDFNTASELSDHSFTHGYLIYGASVLAMYDESFVNDYKDIVEVLLDDYLYPYKDDYDFAYLRSFDPWAGHTWAHGFGTFAEGNNVESSSEALQSWVGGYLWALSQNDVDRRDAAIYGFVTELNAAKTYIMDYSETIFPEKYSMYASIAGMIWGGKYDYATWFGANPTFIYGIQWLPNGEYISNYALNDDERARLNHIYSDYLLAKNQTIDTWFATMWSVQALINPSIAISQFDASKILNDDYPSDLSQTYYLIHSLQSYGKRDTSYIMEIHERVSSSIYVDSLGVVNAMIWNPSDQEQTIIFKSPTNQSISITVPSRSLTTNRLSN
ncbi:glycosyl hydrolase [Peloplasma aerotolerans]|uniref:glucan endo-1,3-beta-D-glucosidase n=1 Tax=Peloplasma aerotolerans TaxID=3044389 RepID=A0AAW6U8D6_9MOLU|nr:glycosyl hydrolase [Mariniplasma sp. M4Ah]MDI6453190.1 glycosyl hydrolase [Mariniplasma sp. M4Ah]